MPEADFVYSSARAIFRDHIISSVDDESLSSSENVRHQQASMFFELSEWEDVQFLLRKTGSTTIMWLAMETATMLPIPYVIDNIRHAAHRRQRVSAHVPAGTKQCQQSLTVLVSHVSFVVAAEVVGLGRETARR